MRLEDSRVVYWYKCNCDWVTKICEEEHRAYARVPLDVLNEYVKVAR